MSFRSRGFATVVTVVLAMGSHAQAGAQSALPTVLSPPGADQLDAVRLAQAAPAKAPTFEWRRHPTLIAGPFEIAFKARAQIYARDSDAPFDEDDVSTIGDLPFKRIGIEGGVRNLLEYQVEREFGDDLDPWRDVYVNISRFREVQFQAGKFKVPFGMDENTSPTDLDFAYRSLAANTIAPGRDIGFMVHGRVWRRIFQYQWGRFEHDGRNARPRSGERVYGGTTNAGRISATPLRSLKAEVDDLEVGFAWTSSELMSEGFSGIRGRTVLGETFFSNDYYVVGQRRRLGVEARWRPGPFSVQWEYSQVTDERLGQSVEDTDLSLLRGRGWYVSGTWAMTGDRKADGLDATKRPLFQGGIGAVEVAARIERLTFDSTAEEDGTLPSNSPRADIILGNSNQVLTFGLNWYLNRWIKMQFNLVKERLTDPEQGPLPERPAFWSRILKVQFTI